MEINMKAVSHPRAQEAGARATASNANNSRTLPLQRQAV
jgi:hypothetical protein